MSGGRVDGQGKVCAGEKREGRGAGEKAGLLPVPLEEERKKTYNCLLHIPRLLFHDRGRLVQQLLLIMLHDHLVRRRRPGEQRKDETATSFDEEDSALPSVLLLRRLFPGVRTDRMTKLNTPRVKSVVGFEEVGLTKKRRRASDGSLREGKARLQLRAKMDRRRQEVCTAFLYDAVILLRSALCRGSGKPEIGGFSTEMPRRDKPT